MTTHEIIRACIRSIEAIEGKKYRDKDFASDMGISPQQLSELNKDKANIGPVIAKKIAKALNKHGIYVEAEDIPDNLSYNDWLFHSNKTDFVNIPYYGTHPENVDGDVIFLRHYKIEVSAGQPARIREPVINQELAFKSGWIEKVLKSSCEHLFLLDVAGHSMEPTLYEGDTVLVDGSRRDLQDDGIYVFRIDHGMVVKRVERHIGGKILIMSDNPRYQPYCYEPEEKDQLIVGRVVWYARTLV